MNLPLVKSADHQAITIAVNNLSKRFNREWIFKSLTYRFQPGHTYAITGPNGSGKSTLLQVVWGQVPQSSGTIQYEKTTSTVSIEDIFRHVSIATPYMDLIEEFTLLEMLNFHFKLKNVRNGLTNDELLEIMYLEDARNKPLMNFSSGMKQRLKLGLAFYTEADIYFLDEPGTNLDSKAFNWFRQELSILPENATILMASNDPEEYPGSATLFNILDYKK